MPAEFTLPSPQEAEALVDGLYADIFFAKMAEYGHAPRTQEDAYAMLETALSLDNLPEPVTKQGSVGAYATAAELLQIKLAEAGIPVRQPAAAQEALAVKQAAVGMASHPELYKAILALKSQAAAA